MNEFVTLLYLFSLIGLSFVLAYGTIFDDFKTKFYTWGIAWYPESTDPIRFKLVSKAFDFICCPMCMGVWIGWIASFAYQPFVNNFLDGFLIGGLCYILDHSEDNTK